MLCPRTHIKRQDSALRSAWAACAVLFEGCSMHAKAKVAFWMLGTMLGTQPKGASRCSWMALPGAAQGHY